MIVAVVASLLVASLCGIGALLGGGFGDLQARIVATTLIVAAFGTSALCHLAVVPRAVRLLGFAGLAASVVAAGAALWLVWSGDELFEGDNDGSVLKTLLVATIVAISLAHANLLLLLAERRRTVIRTGLGLALAAIAVVATMLALPVITDGAVGGREWYWRWFGVAGIVDALGTIALPVLALVLRGRREHWPASAGTTSTGSATGTASSGTAAEDDGTGTPDAAPEVAADAAPVRVVLDLPADLVARLDAAADGQPRDAAALRVLRNALVRG
ncbi:hypothetical protein XF36_13335 [Pseudonocardia sp. HH130629-09]|nr:hypothetical protein XF36_13335 [Pseudonocardia sp. HH130629-09]